MGHQKIHEKGQAEDIRKRHIHQPKQHVKNNYVSSTFNIYKLSNEVCKFISTQRFKYIITNSYYNECIEPFARKKRRTQKISIISHTTSAQFLKFF